jgi:hypothetical protein
MTIIQSISAGLTEYARELRARGEAEGVVMGDWSFQVGTDGFEALNPDTATAVDFTQQALSAAVGGTRYLGRVVSSGAAASTSIISDGHVQINGLSGIAESITNKWLRISGSADTAVNGTWIIGQWVSATSVIVYNPLMTADDAGPLSWELREACVLRPNLRAPDFHGRLLAPDATVDGQELGQVGIFGRVIAAPTDPALLGLDVLWAVAHHPAIAKFDEMTVNYHIVIQR